MINNSIIILDFNKLALDCQLLLYLRKKVDFMDVVEIYQHKSKDIDSEIFKLENDRLIIKHSNSQTEKLNINQWEEINYIPEDYLLVDRKLNKKEKRAINSFIERKPRLDNNKSLPGRLIDKVKNVFN